MKPINGGICAVDGIRAGGLRDGKNGLAVILLEGKGHAAAVYTRNRMIAAPLLVTIDTSKAIWVQLRDLL